MRVNVYAEEMTRRVEIVEKNGFTGLRVYLHLPVSYYPVGPTGEIMPAKPTDNVQAQQLKGPFMHHPGDDDSAAITFWGKGDLRGLLDVMRDKLDEHYEETRRRNQIINNAAGRRGTVSQTNHDNYAGDQHPTYEQVMLKRAQDLSKR